MREKLFGEDEMKSPVFDPKWTVDELLSQEGVFFLKDVIKILDLEPVHLKRDARALIARGESPYRPAILILSWCARF